MLPKALMPCRGPRYRPAMSHCGVPISAAADNDRLPFSFPMDLTLAPTMARLRCLAFAAAPQGCARVLRMQQAHSHGVPPAFVSLSGVTAMLSAAVRKA